MSRRRTLTTFFMLSAAGVAAVAAWASALYVERSSVDAVARALSVEGNAWAELHADGLQLIVAGTAPSEPARLRALSRAGRIVDPARLVDAMEVAADEPLGPARYGLEILRNESGVSVIGLVPETMNPAVLERGLSGYLDVTNMVETANRAVPANWGMSVEYGFEALRQLPKAKISVSAGRVKVTAIAESDAERRRLESRLARAAPEGLDLVLEIASPRPVITPFTLRFVREVGNARFEACAVDSFVALSRVQAAAKGAGFEGQAGCVIGLGVPSASWGGAVAQAIGALTQLGEGSVTFSDADVTLVVTELQDDADFEQIIADLDASLPDIYSLSAVRPDPVVIDGTGEGEGTPEFVATRSPEGQVQLRGRLRDELQQAAVASYGRALFGSASTYIATREDPDLPAGWPTRVLAGLDALSRLENGVVVVQPEVVDLKGQTGNKLARADISRILSEKLGEAADFRIDVTYVEELDPTLNIPTPEECIERLNAVQDGGKLSFAPGEAVLEEASARALGDVVGVLRDCSRVVVEVGGHTDSQGREEMNAELSRQRAEAVRIALIERGVPSDQLVSAGYGEAQPIATNDTEAGREANRRIAFTLAGRRAKDAPAARQTLDEVVDEIASELEAEASADDDSADGPVSETETGPETETGEDG